MLNYFESVIFEKLKTKKADKSFRASVTLYVYASIGTLLAAALYFFVGLRLLSAFIVLAAIIFCTATFVYLKGYKKTTIILSLIGVSIVTLAGDIILGIGSGAHYFLLASVMLYISTDRKTFVFRYVTGFICLGEFTAICIFLTGETPVVALPIASLATIDKVNLLIAFGAIGFTMHSYSNATEENDVLHREYNSKLLVLANSDQLTGLPNRRSAYQILERLVEKYYITGTEFVVGLADIDDFKHINDTYGHLYGDDVLIKYAAMMKNSLRKTDFVSRWGGEEFLIIMPDTSMCDGMEIIKRMKEIFGETMFSFENQRVPISTTIGVAGSAGISSIFELMHQADEHLYAGKRSGKNCVVGPGVQCGDIAAHVNLSCPPG